MEQTTTLIPIGGFSRLSGLTIKALRHYDEIGLLEPARVDASSGYRYYALEQLRQADAVARLRALDLPLDECKAILGEPARRSRLEERRAELGRSIDALAGLIDDPARLTTAPILLEKVEVKELAPQAVLTIGTRTTPDGLDAVIPESINGVAAYIDELGAKRNGPPFTICPEPEDDGAIEVAVGWPTAEQLPGHGRVESRVLPGGPVAWAVYRGAYTELTGAYRALYEWIVEHGHETAGEPREVYYTDPDEVPDPADYVTGIVWPIR